MGIFTWAKAPSYLCYSSRMCFDGHQKHMPMRGGGKGINECLGMSSTCPDVDLVILLYLNEKRIRSTSHLVSNLTVTSVIEMAAEVTGRVKCKLYPEV